MGGAAYHLDMPSQYRPHLQHVVDREPETGAVATGMVMLHQIMLDQMAVGEWAEACGDVHDHVGLAGVAGPGLVVFAAN